MKFAFFLISFSIINLISGTQDSLIESINRGEEIYFGYCITCHMDQGQGIEGVFPPLAQSDYLMENKERSISVVKYGQEGEIVVNGTTYNNIMSPMGLSDEEITDVLNFIRNSWGNQGEIVTPDEVAQIKE